MPDHPALLPSVARLFGRVAGGNGAARFNDVRAIDVPVDGGTVRVFHFRGTGSGRPVVFVAGWGSLLRTFADFYSGASPETEVYHVETREKSSSRIDRRSADFHMDQFALDLAMVLAHFGLDARDPVLVGACFGSAVILHALAHRAVDARSVVCFDPMIRLWMPRWIIRIVGPILPAWGLTILRPLLRTVILAGMREPVQRARTAEFINAAEVWKWRRAAIHLRDWDFFSHADLIGRRVYVVNGSHDRFHDSCTFPDVARALPDGVFVAVPAGESRRERLMGVTATLFSRSQVGGVPPALEEFLTPR